MKKLPIIISICAILIVTAVAYLPSLNSGFVNWDDDIYVTENPKIKDLSWKNVVRIFTSTHYGGYEPLTELTFALEYHFFGLNPRIYHATNLFLHLLNCLLVFWLLFLISNRLEVAFIAAILFGVHPLHVESVAWIAERKDVLYAFFSLGSLITYLLYSRKKLIKFYYLSLVLFLVSLLPKPQGISLPLVLFLCDYLEGRKIDRKTILEKTPFFIVSAIFVFIAVIGSSSANQLTSKSFFAVPSNLLSSCYGLASYVVKLLFPVKLSCIYPYIEEMGPVLPPLFLLSPMILATLALLVIFSGKFSKKLIFAGLFFLINLLPVLQIIRTGKAIAADRYSYIPSIALFYIVGESLFWLYREKVKDGKVGKAFIIGMLITIIALYSFLTWQRCQVWKDSLTLWGDALSKHDYASVAHGNLGAALAASGRDKEAVYHYAEALRINPKYPEAHNNFGNYLAKQGKLEEAIFHYRQAVGSKPNYTKAYINLGITLYEKGNFEEASFSYLKALQFNPENERVHNGLGVALVGQRKFEEAVSHFYQALHLKPEYPEAHYNLGLTLVNQDKYEEALSHFNEALRIRPDFPEARRNRRSALEKMKEGKPGEVNR